MFDDKLEEMCNVAVVGYCNMTFQHFPGSSVKTKTSVRSACLLTRTELMTSRLWKQNS